MIVQETITFEGRQLTRTYSDENRYVVRDGVSYSEAVDPIEFPREYTEGDYMDEDSEHEDSGDDEEETTAQEIINILIGEESVE